MVPSSTCGPTNYISIVPIVVLIHLRPVKLQPLERRHAFSYSPRTPQSRRVFLFLESQFRNNQAFLILKCTPALKKNLTEKAETLRQSFFLWPNTADLLDIDGYEYLPALEFPAIMLLEIESTR
jgi:hypothetical protein